MRNAMVRLAKTGLAMAALAGAFLVQPVVHAQEAMKQEPMAQDAMKADAMKQDKMMDDKVMHDATAKTLFTGKFHGKVHATEGRATAKTLFTGKFHGKVHATEGRATAKTLFTGKFHGKVHATEGRATVYQEKDGKLVLRLTKFKTSNGPDVHVILVATKDAMDDANILKDNTEKLELGKLKGNEGDQNYEIPAGTDLTKYRTVSVYCERFNANFGAAPLEKF